MHQVEISQEVIQRVLARRGRMNLFDRLEPAKTAFVVIDMQNAFCRPEAAVDVPAARGIVPNINALATRLRDAGGDVVWVTTEIVFRRGRSEWDNFFDTFVSAAAREATIAQLAPGSAGVELWPELDATLEDLYLVKKRYSAFAPSSSHLERVLRSRGIENVLIGGTKTNVCCETTGRDAFDLDFRVVLVSDCTAALSDREHLAALETFLQQFGDVLTAEEVAARLSEGPSGPGP